MSTAGADFPIDRIVTDDVAEMARIRLTLRQGERETLLRTGEMAVTRSREASRCEREAHARSIELRIPEHAVTPTARELDAIMVAPISAPEPLAMLRRYVDGLLD